MQPDIAHEDFKKVFFKNVSNKNINVNKMKNWEELDNFYSIPKGC